jgi:trk system potassium uptake protein
VKFHLVLQLLGRLLLGLAVLLLIPFGVALGLGGGDRLAFGISALITAVVGGLLVLAVPFRSGEELGHREGFAIVTLAWVSAALFGGLPYYLAGSVATYTDAFFEAMSGFTTTGSTILTRIEGLPLPTLLWRNLTQWIGGIGIVVVALAVLPALGVGGMQLYKAEVPAPGVDRLAPRIRDTARLLGLVYLVLSVAVCGLLLLGGMSWFDAIAHTFTVASTGGFSPRDASIGAYNSVYIDAVMIVFMFLGAANFALHYRALRGNVVAYRRNPEFLVYTAVLAGATGLLTVTLWIARTYGSLPEALRYAAFQVVSMGTTTGYTTTDYGQWPPFAQWTLLVLMFLGGSAGSTAGALKQIRVLLVAKRVYAHLFRLVHPRAVVVVRLGDRPVPEDVLNAAQSYCLLYAGMFALATLAVSAFGLDLVTAAGAVAATLGCIGPGLGEVVATFAHLPLPVKWILSACMLLGRLEIYTVLVLFTPGIWRK